MNLIPLENRCHFITHNICIEELWKWMQKGKPGSYIFMQAVWRNFARIWDGEVEKIELRHEGWCRGSAVPWGEPPDWPWSGTQQDTGIRTSLWASSLFLSVPNNFSFQTTLIPRGREKIVVGDQTQMKSIVNTCWRCERSQHPLLSSPVPFQLNWITCCWECCRNHLYVPWVSACFTQVGVLVGIKPVWRQLWISIMNNSL